MAIDAREVPVSVGTALALVRFEEALQSFQSYQGDPIAGIDRALADEPDFLLGHLFRALVLTTLCERRFMDEARHSLAAVRELLGAANERERGLYAAAEKLVAGEWETACAGLDRVLEAFPRDALALQVAHLFDFYRGDSLNLRNRVVRVFPAWASDLPGFGYLLGMLAFGLEECNQYPEAEQTGLRALALEPRDVWAVHAVVHVMEMTGRTAEGRAWMQAREADWAIDNTFAFHNWWHLALFCMDQEDFDAALNIYDTQLAPPADPYLLLLVDATALLWRLRLDDVPLGERPDALADAWARALVTEGGFYAFNDWHGALSYALCGRTAHLRDAVTTIKGAALDAAGDNRRMSARAGLPLIRATECLANGEHGAAAELLAEARDHASVFGGSHAQRDLISLTLIHEALRAGRPRLAQHVLNERRVLRPSGHWHRRLQGLIDSTSR